MLCRQCLPQVPLRSLGFDDFPDCATPDVHGQQPLQDLMKVGIYFTEALDSTKPSEPMEHAPHDPWQHVMVQQ